MIVNKSSTCKETMIWIFRATPNASNSYTMQEMLYKNAQKNTKHEIRIDESETYTLLNK